MSKIICDVCGTSYPDTASQCPICGCVRSADAQGVTVDELDSQNGGYTYVKGGRFSKSNVKKRNKATPKPAPKDNYDQEPQEEDEQEEKSNTGLLIIAILLLLAIVAVVIYIALHFFGPAASKPTAAPPVNTGNVSVQSTSRPVVTDPVVIPCNSVSLDVTAITFKIKNAVRMLNVSVQPANTTDEVVFLSSNPAVVTVNNEGKVLAVGHGEAVITVICGNAVFSCNVECTFEDPSTETTVPPVSETTPPPATETTPLQQDFTLNRKDITFQRKGESWMIYSGNLGLSLITWSSDNEDVATIKNGKVTAVGSGTTTIYAEYNGEKVSCIIRCSFEDENENPGVGGNGGVTEDGGSSDTTGEGYSLKNMVGGRNDDVTITVGYSFSLQLIDGQGNPVSNVAWSSSNDSVCTVVDGKVTGVGSGLATVTASYEGKTYKCIIHVN